MIPPKWESLPEYMRNEKVKKYYDSLKKRRINLFFKRAFDIAVSFVLLIILLPFIAIISLLIKLDSPGPVFYRQVRVTSLGKRFRIHKFRSMVTGADKVRSLTVKGDNRITRIGKFIRKYRLDEVSQLIDVLEGNMTFVGTRPEIEKYVKEYSPEMYATLLLPAGVTSEASIYYKDEAFLLDSADKNDADKIYTEKILPEKMAYNLSELTKTGVAHDIKIMFKTAFAVAGKPPKRTAAEKVKVKESV